MNKSLKQFLKPLFLAYEERKHKRFHGKYAKKYPGEKVGKNKSLGIKNLLSAEARTSIVGVPDAVDETQFKDWFDKQNDDIKGIVFEKYGKEISKFTKYDRYDIVGYFEGDTAAQKAIKETSMDITHKLRQELNKKLDRGDITIEEWQAEDDKMFEEYFVKRMPW